MITCFFCQTLLSDYVEDVLPAARKSEIRKHLEECKKCTAAHQELTSSLEILAAMPGVPISHELALQITETAMEGARGLFRPTAVFKAMGGTAAVCALAFGMYHLFPSLFGWVPTPADSAHLVRYYPLQHGAGEIVDEHANWLQIRDSSMRSVWEEGGLSPDEFEKSFQPRDVASTPGGEGEGGPETDTDTD